jgi:ribosome-associated protein
LASKKGPRSLAKKLAQLALEKKAEDVVMLDLTKLWTVTDFFLLCSCQSEVQVKAVADYMIEEMKKNGTNVWHLEGYEGRRWILLDFVEVVAHVFHHEMREFYQLDRLWGDAEREEITE